MKITSINDNRSSCFFFSQLEHIKHCTCVYWEIFHTEYYILFSFNEKQQTSKVNVSKETVHFKTNHRRSSVQYHSQCLGGLFAYLDCRCCLIPRPLFTDQRPGLTSGEGGACWVGLLGALWPWHLWGLQQGPLQQSKTEYIYTLFLF